MRSLVVYESMFGNTHEVADEIASRLEELGPVTVAATSSILPSEIDDVTLLVVGGPTHTHGMSSKASRRSAARRAEEDEALDLDDEFGGPGLRDWLRALPAVDGRFCAAFDTRADKPELLSGSAARGIARRLRHHGYRELVEHESFVLDGHGPMAAEELERARNWGRAIARHSKALNIV